MSELDIDHLQTILNLDIHNNLIETNLSLIAKEKNDILQRLNLERDSLKSIHSKLKTYRYIDSLTDLKSGYYIRWINIQDAKLRKGGFFLDVKLLDNGCHVICKTFQNRIIQISLEENVLFQKLSSDERIILKAIELLKK
uniref:Uncharacterized protein n=1 Tax=Megaviridae environmental sample TaxID=1737588 RepID=A0A5J6VMA0_9VIRU|nr:MAG: hypothetical protein [Megaviridae environmental sample]